MNSLTVPPHYPTGSFTEGKEQQVTLKCEPDGSPKPITILWKKNGVSYKQAKNPDSNLVFQNVSRIDTGKYTCEAMNDAGTANKIPTTDLVIKCKYVSKILNDTIRITYKKYNDGKTHHKYKRIKGAMMLHGKIFSKDFNARYYFQMIFNETFSLR